MAEKDEEQLQEEPPARAVEAILGFAQTLYRCTLCSSVPAVLTSKYSFIEHFREVHDSKASTAYNCSECQLRFSTQNDLHTHDQQCHLEDLSDGLEEPPDGCISTEMVSAVNMPIRSSASKRKATTPVAIRQESVDGKTDGIQTQIRLDRQVPIWSEDGRKVVVKTEPSASVADISPLDMLKSMEVHSDHPPHTLPCVVPPYTALMTDPALSQVDPVKTKDTAYFFAVSCPRCQYLCMDSNDWLVHMQLTHAASYGDLMENYKVAVLKQGLSDLVEETNNNYSVSRNEVLERIAASLNNTHVLQWSTACNRAVKENFPRAPLQRKGKFKHTYFFGLRFINGSPETAVQEFDEDCDASFEYIPYRDMQRDIDILIKHIKGVIRWTGHMDSSVIRDTLLELMSDILQDGDVINWGAQCNRAIRSLFPHVFIKRKGKFKSTCFFGIELTESYRDKVTMPVFRRYRSSTGPEFPEPQETTEQDDTLSGSVTMATPMSGVYLNQTSSNEILSPKIHNNSTEGDNSKAGVEDDSGNFIKTERQDDHFDQQADQHTTDGKSHSEISQNQSAVKQEGDASAGTAENDAPNTGDGAEQINGKYTKTDPRFVYQTSMASLFMDRSLSSTNTTQNGASNTKVFMAKAKHGLEGEQALLGQVDPELLSKYKRETSGSHTLMKGIVLHPGPFVMARIIHRQYSGSRVSTVDTVIQAMLALQNMGLGTMKRLMQGKSKVFFKALPDESLIEPLTEFDIALEDYKLKYAERDPKLPDSLHGKVMFCQPYGDLLKRFYLDAEKFEKTKGSAKSGQQPPRGITNTASMSDMDHIMRTDYTLGTMNRDNPTILSSSIGNSGQYSLPLTWGISLNQRAELDAGAALHGNRPQKSPSRAGKQKYSKIISEQVNRHKQSGASLPKPPENVVSKDCRSLLGLGDHSLVGKFNDPLGALTTASGLINQELLGFNNTAVVVQPSEGGNQTRPDMSMQDTAQIQNVQNTSASESQEVIEEEETSIKKHKLFSLETIQKCIVLHPGSFVMARIIQRQYSGHKVSSVDSIVLAMQGLEEMGLGTFTVLPRGKSKVFYKALPEKTLISPLESLGVSLDDYGAAFIEKDTKVLEGQYERVASQHPNWSLLKVLSGFELADKSQKANQHAKKFDKEIVQDHPVNRTVSPDKNVMLPVPSDGTLPKYYVDSVHRGDDQLEDGVNHNEVVIDTSDPPQDEVTITDSDQSAVMNHRPEGSEKEKSALETIFRYILLHPGPFVTARIIHRQLSSQKVPGVGVITQAMICLEKRGLGNFFVMVHGKSKVFYKALPEEDLDTRLQEFQIRLEDYKFLFSERDPKLNDIMHNKIKVHHPDLNRLREFYRY